MTVEQRVWCLRRLEEGVGSPGTTVMVVDSSGSAGQSGQFSPAEPCLSSMANFYFGIADGCGGF